VKSVTTLTTPESVLKLPILFKKASMRPDERLTARPNSSKVEYSSKVLAKIVTTLSGSVVVGAGDVEGLVVVVVNACVAVEGTGSVVISGSGVVLSVPNSVVMFDVDG